MGPIISDPQKVEVFTELLRKNLEDQIVRQGYIDDASAFTGGGRAIRNPVTSQAVLQSASPTLKLEAGVEGKKLSNVVKAQQAAKLEQAILEAAKAMYSQIPSAVAPNVKPILPAPAVPAISPGAKTAGLAGLFLELLMQSSELNANESKDLEARRKQPPTIRN